MNVTAPAPSGHAKVMLDHGEAIHVLHPNAIIAYQGSPQLRGALISDNGVGMKNMNSFSMIEHDFGMAARSRRGYIHVPAPPPGLRCLRHDQYLHIRTEIRYSSPMPANTSTDAMILRNSCC